MCTFLVIHVWLKFSPTFQLAEHMLSQLYIYVYIHNISSSISKGMESNHACCVSGFHLNRVF